MLPLMLIYGLGAGTLYYLEGRGYYLVNNAIQSRYGHCVRVGIAQERDYGVF